MNLTASQGPPALPCGGGGGQRRAHPPDSTTSTSRLHRLDHLWRRRPFSEGEDILLQEQDGLMYFGIVVEVDHEAMQCLVRFGDYTEKWSPFYDLRRLGTEADELEESEVFDAGTDSYMDDEEDDLPLKTIKKSKSLRLLPPPPPPPKAKKSTPPRHVIDARKVLPYQFDSLVWDDSHHRNELDKYCYCGESGVWYRKMLQCHRCHQWFHQKCLVNKSIPAILFGDRFFEFVCSICTGRKEEAIRRLDLSEVEALHLVLFHMTVEMSKKYHDLEGSVLPFFRRNWKCLQGPGGLLKPSRIDPHLVNSLLSSNKSRFKCGSESKKRSTFWGLRKVAPPVLPNKYGMCFNDGVNINYKCRLEKQQWYNRQNHHQQQQLHKTKGMAKKRGRPPRQQQNQLRNDSLENSPGDSDDDGSSSRGTLDSFIPPPKDFEGFNNPFRNLGIGPFAVPTSVDVSPISLSSNNASSNCGGLLMIHDPGKVPPIVGGGSMESPDPSAARTPGKFLCDLKCSLNSYFGAETRMAKGERFGVMARRLNLDEDIQYLLEWEQPNPLSPAMEPAGKTETTTAVVSST